MTDDKLANTPLVSVVVATYNGENFLHEQLNSIINQTYRNIEIIVVDDCSTDNTINIINGFLEKYAHIKLFVNDKNIGYVKNFERGFLLARGDFIAPSDQDDIWLPTKIEVLLSNIGDKAIAYCNSSFIDSQGNTLGEKMNTARTLTDFDSPIMYTIGASAPGHAMLITKQVVVEAIPFPTLFPHDTWLGFVATFTSSLKFVDDALVLYRRHDKNVFGAILRKDRNKNNPKNSQKVRELIARERAKLLYNKCPDNLSTEKAFFKKLCDCCESYSLANNYNRMRLFFKYRREILMYKKHNELRRCLFCLKVFFKIV